MVEKAVDSTDKPRIDVLGQKTFAFKDDAHYVVTFLNKTLKYHNLIFGLTQNADGTFNLTIYEVVDPKPHASNSKDID